MKKIILFTIVFLISSTVAQAGSWAKSGFSIGLGIPGFGMIDHDSQDDGAVFGMNGALKLAYAPVPSLRVYLENDSAFGMFKSWDSEGAFLNSWMVGVQFFPVPIIPVYIAPRVGAGVAIAFNEDQGLFDDADGFGFSAGSSMGVEIPLTDHFSLSPELRFDYYRTHGANAYHYGGLLYLEWHL